MVHRHPFIPRHAGPARREHRHRRRLREQLGTGYRRGDHGAQQVRPAARAVDRRGVEGLVGRGTAVPYPRLRAHPSRPALDRDEGGTTFHFIDASPAQALAAAREAAGGLDVRIGGGPAVIRQFLAADLIDHMHIALVPVLLGRGEPLWDGLADLEERFAIESVSSPSGVTHITFTRRSRAWA